MSAIRNFMLGCALSLAALSPIDAANAVNLGVPAIALDKQSDVTEARVVCDYYGCYRVRPRHYRPRHHFRHGHHYAYGHRHKHHPRYYRYY